jgi:hypothetical protein
MPVLMLPRLPVCGDDAQDADAAAAKAAGGGCEGAFGGGVTLSTTEKIKKIPLALSKKIRQK